MNPNHIKRLTEECILQVDAGGLVLGSTGAVDLFFEKSEQLDGKRITDVCDIYDYQSGEKLESLDCTPSKLIVINTNSGIVTAELQLKEIDDCTYLVLHKADLVETAIVKKCEYENKKDFLAALGKLSHDFNNLLGVVMGHAELANYLKDNEEVRTNHIHQVLKSSNKIKDLIKQVLVYRHHLDPMPLDCKDLQAIVDLAVGDVRQNLDYPVSINVKQPGEVPVKQSMTRMLDVFRNIVKNAVEAIGKENGKIDVEIQMAQDSRFHKVIVKDNGVGMSKRTMEQMFEPFFSTNSRMKSAGVGLSIAKGILDDIGGEIDIKSELGEGTTVTISIPVRDENTKGKVLLVDDEKMVLGVTSQMVESLGYTVVSCEDLSQGEMALNNELFDIMLIDHHLNDGSGMDLVEYARSNGIKTPAILSCGHHQEGDFENDDIAGFLMKPASMKEIETMFNSVLTN